MFSELEVIEALIPAAEVADVRQTADAVSATLDPKTTTYAVIEAGRLAEYKKRGYSISVSKPA